MKIPMTVKLQMVADRVRQHRKSLLFWLIFPLIVWDILTQ